MILTPALIHTAGWNAGNASMKTAGCHEWNEEDYKAAHREALRLYAITDADPATAAHAPGGIRETLHHMLG